MGRVVRPEDRAEAAAAANRGRRDRAVADRRGLTTGDVAAHFDDVYGVQVSKDISGITDKVIDEMTEWQNRPLDRV